MVRPLLLQPDVAGVVVGQLDDEHPLVLWQRRGDVLDQLLLPLDIHRREQLVLVNRLQQVPYSSSHGSSTSEKDGTRWRPSSSSLAAQRSASSSSSSEVGIGLGALTAGNVEEMSRVFSV